MPAIKVVLAAGVLPLAWRLAGDLTANGGPGGCGHPPMSSDPADRIVVVALDSRSTSLSCTGG